MKEISRHEAELIFRKLAEEEASVFCIGDLWGWRLMLRGKLVVRESEVTLQTGAGGGFILRLDHDDMVFWYSEPGRMPLPDSVSIPAEAQDSACVSVALPLRVQPAALPALAVANPPVAPFREKLLFLEIREVMER